MEEDKNGISQMRFPQKLWYLMNLRTDAIIWGGTGRTILLNYKYLGTYLKCNNSIFKTTNISSFVRQLNLYGFKKVTSHLLDPICNSSNPHMHEYMHSYFQFGRPELLNNITRKAFAVKRSFKPKVYRSDLRALPFSTALQRARYALRIALNKAARDLYKKDCSNAELQVLGYEDAQNGCYEEEDEDINESDGDWSPKPTTTTHDSQTHNIQDPVCIAEATSSEPACETTNYNPEDTDKKENIVESQKSSEKITINFDDETIQSSNEIKSLPERYADMPQLDAEPNNNDLLSEFNISNDADEVITKRLAACTSSQDNDMLNCVLPSICQLHDVSIPDKSTCYSTYYSSEWEQMLNDIIANKNSSQDFSSDVKEFYSQMSKTIDLMNS